MRVASGRVSGFLAESGPGAVVAGLGLVLCEFRAEVVGLTWDFRMDLSGLQGTKPDYVPYLI